MSRSAPAGTPRLSRVFACAAIALLAAATAASAEAPRIFTNADLPTTLSVSVIGSPGGEEGASSWYDMEEIERIARLNERARRELESRRVEREPEILVVERHDYPWIVSNVGCVGFSRCLPWGRRGSRSRPSGPGLHQRQALPDPPGGYVLRPGPHLGPVGEVPDTIRGRPVRMRPPRPPGRNAPEQPAMRAPERGSRGKGAGRSGRRR